MDFKSIEICKSCKNRAFDPKQGVLCGITQEKPIIVVEHCPDYNPDSIIANDRIYRKNKQKKDDIFSFIAGLVFILSGLGWVAIGFPIIVAFFLTLVGISLTVRSIYKTIKLHAAQPKDDHILDR